VTDVSSALRRRFLRSKEKEERRSPAVGRLELAFLPGSVGSLDQQRLLGGSAIVLAADWAAARYVQLDVKGRPYEQLPGSAKLTEKRWRAVCRRSPRGRPPCKS